MPHFFVDGLPGFDSRLLNRDSFGPLLLRVHGSTLFLRSSRFMSRISAQSGEVEWLIEIPPAITTISEATSILPRRIHTPLWPDGFELWYSETDDILAELLPAEDGSAVVSARDAATGRPLWEHFIPVPAAAIWAEQSAAWPGAQTEEIDAFLCGPFAQSPISMRSIAALAATCLSGPTGVAGVCLPSIPFLAAKR